MAESLMTVVLSPYDTDTVFVYFEKYPDEKLALDQLYMSLAIHASLLPDTVTNNGVGVANGRSEVVLDASLTGNCPAETQRSTPTQ